MHLKYDLYNNPNVCCISSTLSAGYGLPLDCQCVSIVGVWACTSPGVHALLLMHECGKRAYTLPVPYPLLLFPSTS